MNPQLIADLEAARALIDTPEKWLKGHFEITPPMVLRSGGVRLERAVR